MITINKTTPKPGNAIYSATLPDGEEVEYSSQLFQPFVNEQERLELIAQMIKNKLAAKRLINLCQQNSVACRA